MQSINILMTVVQIFILMNVVTRLTHIKNFDECTESELNRMTDKILSTVLFCGLTIVGSLLACLVVYKFHSIIGVIAQLFFTSGIVVIWVIKIKEITKFEITLLKRRVGRARKRQAIAESAGLDYQKSV